MEIHGLFCCVIYLLLLDIPIRTSGSSSSDPQTVCGNQEYYLANIKNKVEGYMNIENQGTNIQHYIDQMDLEMCPASNADHGANEGDGSEESEERLKSDCSGIWFTQISTKMANVTFHPNEDDDCKSSLQWIINRQNFSTWPEATKTSKHPFHYRIALQSDFCLRNRPCVPMNLTNCGYSERYCANDIQSTIEKHTEEANETKDDVILFTDSIVISQPCSTSNVFAPLPAIKGIGLTKIQRTFGAIRVRFQFFAFVSANNVELTLEKEGPLTGFRVSRNNTWSFKCKSEIRSSERWNLTVPISTNQSHTVNCSDGGEGAQTMLIANAKLFRNPIISRSITTNLELKFVNPDGDLVYNSAIKVENGETNTFNWKMKCETTPTITKTTVPMPSAVNCSPSGTQAQTTEDYDEGERYMLKEERLKAEECKITSAHLAITACLSFLAGAIVMLLLLLLLRFFRKTGECDCFGREDKENEDEKGKKDSTMPMQIYQNQPERTREIPIKNSVTQPVYGDQKIYSKQSKDQGDTEHVYDISQTAYETLDTKGIEKSDIRSDEHVYNTAENTYQSLAGQATADTIQKGGEHVYTGLAEKKEANQVNETDSRNGAANNTVDRLDDLFENRDSAISEHNYFTLQNDNYRNSNKAEEPGTAAPNLVEDPGTYFVLEKETKAEDEDTKAVEQTENNYFVLEKNSYGAQNGDVSTTDENHADGNAYFVLEKPVQ